MDSYRPAAEEAFVVNPKDEHIQTFILLHGRGDQAMTFGCGLLNMMLPDGSNLRSQFPNAKFVFMQAPLRHLKAAPGMKFFQWFDVMTLRPGGEEHDLQVPDLKQTIDRVHETLRHEIELVGAENVVLGGLSQGCASSLASLILWDGPPFAACIGMSGWLPFRRLMEDAIQSCVTKDGENRTEQVPAREAAAGLAGKLGYGNVLPLPLPIGEIPIFMGHGTEDQTVMIQLGQEATACLSALGGVVTYKDYPGLGHWYSPSMLEDVVKFIRTTTKWMQNEQPHTN